MPLVARSKKLLLSLPLKRPMQNLKEKKLKKMLNCSQSRKHTA
jgi:hypothetical protein